LFGEFEMSVDESELEEEEEEQEVFGTSMGKTVVANDAEVNE
jgi:hypothetical protein